MGYSKIESSMISCWKDKNMNSSDPNSKKPGYLLAYCRKTLPSCLTGHKAIFPRLSQGKDLLMLLNSSIIATLLVLTQLSSLKGLLISFDAL